MEKIKHTDGNGDRVRLGTILLSILLLSLPWGLHAQHSTAPHAVLPPLLAEVPELHLSRSSLPIKLPSDITLGMLSWIAPDPKTGEIWLLQRGEAYEPIIAVDRGGRIVHAFGRGHFKIPHAIRIDPEGNVWTVDAGSSKVIQWTRTGSPVLTLDLADGTAASQKEFGGATDVAFGPGGTIFVTDGYRNARVVEFTRTGRRLREWGSAGAGPGQFKLPHSIVVDPNGVVYVADRENGRIEEFDLHGRFTGEIAGLGRTYALALGPEKVLWASMAPMDQPAGSPGWLVKFDRKSGRALGFVPVRDAQVLHSVAVIGREPLTDAGNGVLWFRETPAGQPAR